MVPIYDRSPGPGSCLQQGEILTDLVRFVLDVAGMVQVQPTITKITYPFAIVLSQACDLAQDFTARREGKPQLLPDVLLCHVPTAEELRAPPQSINSKIWDRIHKNKDERYHFLERIPSECDLRGLGLPELCLDFKMYFSMPTDELYRRFELGPTVRRTIICSPYLEHLSSRFSYFLGRVALPADHHSQ